MGSGKNETASEDIADFGRCLVFNRNSTKKSVDFENGPIGKTIAASTVDGTKYDRNAELKIAVKVYHTK